jgi:hypothetical protein
MGLERESRIGFLEFSGNFEIVVDFAVENHDMFAGMGSHRLVCGIRQIDDAQAPVTESATINIRKPRGIGTAMCHPIGHGYKVIL